jgi:mRNA-degrading endonuclease RelE of RelBE toxin-antitoxin system
MLNDGPRNADLDIVAELIESGPRIPLAIELHVNPGAWRVPFYDRYRMICEVSRARREIFVTRIRNRSSAYRGMKN